MPLILATTVRHNQITIFFSPICHSRSGSERREKNINWMEMEWMLVSCDSFVKSGSGAWSAQIIKKNVIFRDIKAILPMPLLPDCNYPTNLNDIFGAKKQNRDSSLLTTTNNNNNNWILDFGANFRRNCVSMVNWKRFSSKTCDSCHQLKIVLTVFMLNVAQLGSCSSFNTDRWISTDTHHFLHIIGIIVRISDAC